MLAIALFIEKYKRNISNKEKDKQLEHDWLERWRGALRSPSKTSCRIMRAYIDYLYILGTLWMTTSAGTAGQMMTQMMPQ